MQDVRQEGHDVFENSAMGSKYQNTVKNYSLHFPFKSTIIIPNITFLWYKCF